MGPGAASCSLLTMLLTTASRLSPARCTEPAGIRSSVSYCTGVLQPELLITQDCEP